MKFKNLYKVEAYQKDTRSLNKNDEHCFHYDIPLKSSDFSHLNNNTLYYSFLSHSSIFLKIKSINILIDPVFSKKIFKLFKNQNKNLVSAKDFGDLDLVLITHNHYDHLDIKTLKSLNKQTKHFIVPIGVKNLLIRNHIPENKIIELNWYDEYLYQDLKIISTPAHHSSTRFLIDKNKTLWCSYVLSNEEYCIYHSGDSAFSPHFEDIHDKFNNFDLAFMECGQYSANWHDWHMFPEESVAACKILNPKVVVPIHNRGFKLSDHSNDEPVIRFVKEADKQKINYLIPAINQIYKYSK